MVDAGSPHLDGAGLSLFWSIPFAGLILSIALLPLLTPHFWEHHFGKVAALWSLALLLPCAVAFGLRTTAAEALHTVLLDYLPFLILLFTLFVVKVSRSKSVHHLVSDRFFFDRFYLR
jgi:Na+/H+ antiporter NhaD/arsenite permease-like protein